EHIPSIIHIVEMTQPQGHSTSGSHERYKSPERLEWETTFDCINKMREWIVERGIADADHLDNMEKEARKQVETIRREAWQAYLESLRHEYEEVKHIVDEMETYSAHGQALSDRKKRLNGLQIPDRRVVMQAVRDVLITLRN